MDLTELIVQLSDYIFEKEAAVKEGVENIMLNKPYMLESERLYKEGFTQKELKGRTEGRIKERHDMMDSMRKPQTDEVARGPGTGESMAVRDFIQGTPG